MGQVLHGSATTTEAVRRVCSRNKWAMAFWRTRHWTRAACGVSWQGDPGWAAGLLHKA